MLTRHQSQSGITLIELMIGMLLGLVVTGVAINMYISTLGITSQTTRTVRLNQEIRAAMDLMVNDIRRAGYWDGPVVGENPHSKVVSGAGSSARLHVNLFDSPETSSSSLYDCVILSYDYDEDGSANPNHVFGFRLNDSAQIQALQLTGVASGAGAVNCAAGTSSDWVSLTDSKAISVDELEFNYTDGSSAGISAASWADSSSKGIVINLKAHSKADPKLVRQLVEEARVRNEY